MARKHTENKVLILEAIRACGTVGARGGAITLNVMYEVCLSYDRARYYLIELLQSGMIERDVGTKKYRITEKGIRYLTAYHDLDNIVNN
jgi:predicted transcriptional regulator